jgi:hypothetical protein
MKTRLLFLLFLLVVEFFNSCSSGKTAYKHGDYYTASMEAIERLRHSPDNKKSKEVLAMSYQASVDFIDTDIKNQIASNANLKWKTIVASYGRINTLYENVRKSPGALAVIPEPVNRYKELNVAKDSAAAECYDAAVMAMLKNTREDAKQAYFLFTDANNFSPGFRESIEMVQQAKFNATLKVVVEPSFQNMYNWNFDQVIFGTTVNPFVKFYSPQQARDANLAVIDQNLKVTVNGYNEGSPHFAKTNQTYQDSVANGEKTVNGQKVTTYQKVSAQMAIYEKQITTNGSLLFFIQGAENQAVLANSTITSQISWRDQWAICTGDTRAIPKSMGGLCSKSETFPPRDQLKSQTKQDLDSRLTNALSSFYRNY